MTRHATKPGGLSQAVWRHGSRSGLGPPVIELKHFASVMDGISREVTDGEYPGDRR